MSDKPFDYEEAIAQIRARRQARMEPLGEEKKKPVSTGNGPDREKWEEPKSLPSGLAPVEAFNSNFMPDAVAPWVDDVANRLQCPPDYVGVAAITALGSVIGRRIGIKPQQKTDWVEVPNLWGAFIGRPGMLKSPAMREALKPVHRLEAEAAKDNEVAWLAYQASMDVYKVRKQVADQLAKKKLKKDAGAPVDFALGPQPEEPRAVRYRTNDTTYEGLGELLIANPSGVLIERDELISLLKHLDRDDQAVARGFYLTGWSGLDPYTFDRIGRGQRHILAVCVSVLGNTQPVRMAEYVRRANFGGAGGDGLMQRFGLLVWPDAPPDWKDVDEFPNSIARERAWQTFDRASKLDIVTALALGASKGEVDKIPTLRFADDAAAIFMEWRAELERRLRADEVSPALEGHLAKYRKLVPALALINHLSDNHAGGPVSRAAIVRALAFVGYLETHARRVYGSSCEGELAAAKAILLHIKAGDLKNGFTARDVHQRDWAHLTERDQVGAGIELLVELGHLAAVAVPPGPQGGRPTVTYRINPRGVQ
jgi:putative DNA primase/helicase